MKTTKAPEVRNQIPSRSDSMIKTATVHSCVNETPVRLATEAVPLRVRMVAFSLAPTMMAALVEWPSRSPGPVLARP